MKTKSLCIDCWHTTHPEAVWSGRWAKDQDGNEYRQPANLETVTVKMAKTGKEYTGWTLAECYDWAEKESVA